MGAAASKGKVDEKLSNGIQKALNDKWVPIFMKLNDDKSNVQYASIVGERIISADTLDYLANNFIINAQNQANSNAENQGNVGANAAAAGQNNSGAAAGQAAAAPNATRKLTFWERQQKASREQAAVFARHREKAGKVAGAAAGAAGRGIGAAGRGIGAAAGAAGRGIGAAAGAAGRGIGAAASATRRAAGTAGTALKSAAEKAAARSTAAASVAGRGIGAAAGVAGRGIGAAAGAAGRGIGAAAANARRRLGNMVTRRRNRVAPAPFNPITPAAIKDIAVNPLRPAPTVPNPAADYTVTKNPLAVDAPTEPEEDSSNANAAAQPAAAQPAAAPQQRRLMYEPIPAVREPLDGGYKRTKRRKYRKHL
jgi:hypothetical protein